MAKETELEKARRLMARAKAAEKHYERAKGKAEGAAAALKELGHTAKTATAEIAKLKKALVRIREEMEDKLGQLEEALDKADG